MFTVTLNLPRERFARLRGALQDMSKPLDEVGYYVVRKWMPALFKSAGQGTWPPVLRGGSPLWDTHTLATAFTYSLGQNGRSVVIGNSMRYAALQNFGGTVTPKGGKFLAVPLPTLSVVERRNKKPRDFANTFFAKSRNGNLILFEKQGTTGRGKNKKAKIRPLFVMKESVTIPPRTFVKWFPEMRDQAVRIVRDSILKAMRAA